MEMLVLQSQINPHFLYNTLEVIYWKTLGLTGKSNDASKMIEQLSDVLKYALSDPKHTVLLDKVIRYTEIYLEIQKTRNKNKLNVIWEVEEATRHHKVLKLILQPLIENCIYHGIKEKKGICTIKFNIREMSSFLWIRVIDNGKGMTDERLRMVREMLTAKNSSHQDDEEFPASDNSNHIGLYNTNKRLKLSYGNQHSLRILSKFGWGTLVEISLPINEDTHN